MRTIGLKVLSKPKTTNTEPKQTSASKANKPKKTKTK